MADTPNIEPAVLIAGDTLRWTRSLPDYPASAGWLLSYTLINAAVKLTITGSALGDNHSILVPAATSAGYTPGAYDWRARVTLAGEVYTVGEGRFTVKASFGASTYDARSAARRTLDAIEATLEGRASSAVLEYEIASRRLKYIPVSELLQLRDRYRAEVAREDAAAAAAAGLSDRRRVYVRFGP